MKFTIELNENFENDIEIVIKTRKITEEISLIENLLKNNIKNNRTIIFYKNQDEFFIPLEKILFFETENNSINAHTAKDVYKVKFKLYELEEVIPRYFMRISKSTIVNTKSIFSLERSFSGSRSASFYNSLKQVHVSRHYYKILRDKMMEGQQ